MPPENTDPVAKTETSEFDFAASQAENPRIKKRSLKAASPAQTPPEAATRPTVTPDQPRSSTGYTSPSATQASSGEPRPTYVRPGSAPAEKPQTPAPSGVLYYSNRPQNEAAPKMNPTPNPASRPAPTPTQPVSHRPASTPSMQNSPTSRPASSSQPASNRPAAASTSSANTTSQATHSGTSRPAGVATSSTGASHASHASSSRPANAAPSSAGTAGTSRAVSTTVAGPAGTSRPGSVSDYRSNIDRQTREQKSIGGILNFVVYGLIGLFVLGAVLAAYGAHDVYKQLSAQSTTVSELDTRYSAANDKINTQISATQQSVLQLQTQLGREQELLLKQQDSIGKLQGALTAETEALRQEKAARAAEASTRASETTTLRARVRLLENREPSYRP